MSEANTKLATARLMAAKKWPYAAQAILATIPVEKQEVATVAADKYWRLYFNPDFVLTADSETLVSLVLFEVSHLIRSHSKRFQRLLGFDPASIVPLPEHTEEQRKCWNQSADLEIVDDFDEERLKIPSEVQRAKALKLPTGLLAEAYFERLYQKRQPSGGSGSGQGQGQGQQEQGGSSASDGVPRPWDEPYQDQQIGNNSGDQDENSDGQNNESQGEGQDERDSQQEQNVPGISEGESDMLSRQVAQKIADHAKQRGKVPNSLKRWAENLVAPKLNYRKIIERKVQNAIQVIRGNLDYSYRKPSRRSIPNGIISPSMISRQVNIAVVIDASGSMSNKQLGEAVEIVGKLLKALPKRDAIKVLVADTQIHTCDRVFKKEQINLVGGGGTCMDVAIAEAETQKPRPNLVITITDGYTNYPEKPARGINYVTIICSDGTDRGLPKWMECVRVPPKSLTRQTT